MKALNFIELRYDRGEGTWGVGIQILVGPASLFVAEAGSPPPGARQERPRSETPAPGGPPGRSPGARIQERSGRTLRLRPHGQV